MKKSNKGNNLKLHQIQEKYTYSVYHQCLHTLYIFYQMRIVFYISNLVTRITVTNANTFIFMEWYVKVNTDPNKIGSSKMDLHVGHNIFGPDVYLKKTILIFCNRKHRFANTLCCISNDLAEWTFIFIFKIHQWNKVQFFVK